MSSRNETDCFLTDGDRQSFYFELKIILDLNRNFEAIILANLHDCWRYVPRPA